MFLAWARQDRHIEGLVAAVAQRRLEINDRDMMIDQCLLMKL